MSYTLNFPLFSENCLWFGAFCTAEAAVRWMILGHFCRPLLWHHKELLYNYRASDSSNTIFVIYRHIYVQGDTGIVPIYSLKAAEGFEPRGKKLRSDFICLNPDDPWNPTVPFIPLGVHGRIWKCTVLSITWKIAKLPVFNHFIIKMTKMKMFYVPEPKLSV